MAMSGGFIQQTHHRINHESTRKSLVHHLMTVVKELQRKYGGKTELATESDHNVLKLCDSWEYALCHGLRTGSLLRNMSDLVSGVNQEPPVFWTFAYQHMTAHEKERFSSLRHVWTDRGKCRAFIRAALNERSLERYILMWLADSNLGVHYEAWSLMRDEESSNLLPTLAAGLSSILFAITVDSPDLNVQSRREQKTEPIIAVPRPIRPVKKTQKTQVIEFDDAGLSISPVAVGTLASLCLKHESVPSSRENTKSPAAAAAPVKRIPTEEAFNVVEEVPKNPPTNEVFTPPSDSGIVVEEPTTSEEGSFDDSSLRSMSKSSSIHSSSSSSSVVSASDVTHLRERLRQAEERCQRLEVRVAELSLENHRLRGLGTTHHASGSTFTVSVPRVRLEKAGTRKYYVYEVHIIPTNQPGDEWTVLRRYSDFHRLHRQFQKTHPSVKSLDFPPKKSFGNMEAHFVEQRRQRLQLYLRHILTMLPDVATCTSRTSLEQVFPFFK
ncbi:sorting nexin-29 [Lutzomyia longipalpis]|uniref:sorting nexin-29 n=1 Tax=Lutzomyia longipalpis TaxID=7200 RepID=UPI0024841B1F|nr:sorting nexin-29 [Lutzomyia longipalpis]